MAKQPDLTFFCELPADKLEQLFDSTALLKKLRQLDASISMGLLDLTNTRAEAVKKLTRVGIPVTAWLLLPKDQGYWTNLDNVAETVKCYAQFKKWTEENKLQWAAVGLDLEPGIDRIDVLSPHWKEHIPDLIKRFFKVASYQRAEAELQALVNLIRADGFAVETYNFPLVIEERAASSEVISRLLGTPPLDADREVLMLYTSFFKHGGDAALWSYAHNAQAIAVGSTGGGVDVDENGELKSMRWIDLRRDLLLTKEFVRNIYIFSIEGCVRNDYIDRLLDLDWNATVQAPIYEGRKVNIIRKLGEGLLWQLSHPLIMGFAALVLMKLFHPRKHK